MHKICVVTASRAEYGLLRRLIEKIQQEPDLQLQLIVTGTHLDESFGYTVNEILEDGFVPAAYVPMEIGTHALQIVQSMSQCLSGPLGMECPLIGVSTMGSEDTAFTVRRTAISVNALQSFCAHLRTPCVS